MATKASGARALQFSLTGPQAAFAVADDKYPAVVAGYGAGKTESLLARLLMRKVAYPKGWVGYYAPSYDLVSKIARPRISELLDRHGFSYKENKNENMIHVQGYGAFIFRTMENPAAIVGYEHADAGVDELDTLKESHAEEAWLKIVARNRQRKGNGDKNTVAVATTPEGYRFTYKKWFLGNTDPKKGPLGPTPGYVLYRATTYSNLHNLPDDYVSTLEGDYPPQLLQAYLNGEFVNLTAGAVYPDFKRELNYTKETIGAQEEIHVGMDFNINKMAAVIFVIRGGEPMALDEVNGARDTPQMIEIIKERYGNNGRAINVYPDPSGANGSSKGASVSDIAMLRSAGFVPFYPSKHPPVKDRVAAVNAQILNAMGQRKLKVNPDKCPVFVQALEQQVYDKNEQPDKSSGHDHVTDAGGYFIHRRFPIHSAMQRMQVIGG